MKNQESGKIKVNDIDVYYENHGEGEPLLLVEGLGYSTWMWFKQIPDFSRAHQVIIFDNRGVGNTDKPDLEYTIEMMADDVAGLLRALDIKSAHVLGVSMGGFIAQEMAIRHPLIVRSLTLVSTSFSGREIIHRASNSLINNFSGFWEIMPAMLEMSGKGGVPMVNSFGSHEKQKSRRGLSLAFTPEYFDSNQDQIDRIVEWRMANPQPFYAWKRQLMAGMKFDASDRVHQIKAPTLVVTGSEDRIVLPSSSKALAERIPNSRLVEIQGTGHLSFIERAEEFNRIVVSFLEEVAQENKPETQRKQAGTWWRRIILSFFGQKN